VDGWGSSGARVYLSTVLVSPALNSSRDDKKFVNCEKFRYLFHVSRLNIAVGLAAKHNALTGFFGMGIAAKKDGGRSHD